MGQDNLPVVVRNLEVEKVSLGVGQVEHGARECHGLPWGFSGQSIPIPIKTHTHTQGYEFS